MNSSLSINPTLQNRFWNQDNSLLKQSLIMLLGVFVLAFASQLSIPFSPVPLTFQSATVVLIGMTFGAKRGAGVVAAYLAAGVMGLPVFANMSAGVAVFAGPTAGYLAGFLPAAFVVGFLAERGLGKTVAGSILAAFIGAAIIFACGLTVLSTFAGWHNALVYGLLPFVFAEPIKLLAAACVAPTCWK